MATSSSTSSGRQRSSASRTLPTRKSKAAASIAVEPKGEVADEARHHESPGTGGDEDGERTPSSPGDATTDGPTELQPAFRLRDMATIDSLHSSHHPDTARRRSPSPSKGTVVSRRGRSRSPVGLTPRPSGRPSSRSASRAGSGGRPGSRPGSRAGSAGRASAATVPTSGGTRGAELSGAALAAGEAAAGVVAVEHRFAGLPPAMPHPPRGRSPSPVARFPDGSLSFEISPQQSMSFVQPGSFDWNVGPAVGGGLPPSPPPGGHHWHPGYEPHGGQGGAPGYPHGGAQGSQGHGGRRSPSPGRYPPADYRRGDPYPEPREPPHYDLREQSHYDPRYAPAYSSYQGGHRDHYREHPRGRSPSPRPGDLPRRHSQQALFPEHHVRGYDHSGHGGRPARRRSRSPAQAPGRSSVFRGSPTPGKDNLPRELLLALEEEDDDAAPPSSPAKATRKGAKTKAKGAKKGTTTPTKPRKAAKRKSLGRESSTATANPSLAAAPSMLDSVQLDAMLNDAMLTGEYLDANLSFRKSYDLEQVFSFVKEGPHGVAGGMPMTLGSMSFNLGFSESRSHEEGDEKKMAKALQSQSHLGLTPINSFSDGTRVMPAASIDGGMLRAFFSSSPPNAEGVASDDRAPVVHANTPPSYGGGPRGMGPHYNARTPPHAPRRPPCQQNVGFPNKRIKLSTRHCLHPTAADLPARAEKGDFFSLLRNMAPAFGGFRFKLPEMDDASVGLNVVSHDSPPGPADGRPTGGRLGGKPSAGQMAIARRRVASSVCAFGGALPPRTVSPSPSLAAEATIGSVTRAADVGKAITKEERALASKEEGEERARYEEELSGRYLLKEHGLSWDVELHETIAPKVVPGAKGKKSAGGGNTKAATATPKSRAKAIRPPPSVGKFCAPVTPHTPPGNNHAPSPKSPGTPATTPGGREKGTKIKYRCKHCGQPKQGHACPYGKGLVRSIGTMVYPAVNAFVSHEPGRLAPALSEMNNFTSLLSQDASSGPSHASGSHPHQRMPGGPYRPYHVMTPDTSHWSPNTPGGLSTMSSGDHRSPGSVGVHGTRPFPSRTMTRTMSMAPAPAGAISSDALFRDTVVLERAQFRTVRAVSATVPPSATSTAASTTTTTTASAPNPTERPRAYRYPAIPTPYAQRKEMGDALFALSREVPRLADACAAILRDARETDAWDQAVAELTTQVLVVVKCDEGDYGLEGLRRHLVTLGIAC